jgi:2-polyprenyl-6-hydroxyphenyl methylase / 3-demethylubiquinone-9 3-methyltransferase
MSEQSTRNDFFGDYADDWWAEDSKMTPLRSFNEPRFAYFDRFVEDGWSGRTVLDVGCGGGFTSEFLHQRGAVVSGIDVSPSLISAAQRHARATGKDIDYRVGSAEELPYPDASFSVVACIDVVDHVPSPARVVRECHRVLAPGGLFLWVTINRTFRARVMMIWMPERVLRIVPKGAHDYQALVKPHEMLGHITSAGMSPLDDMAGIAIRGRRKDGGLRTKLTKSLATTFMGTARRPG